MKLSRLMGVVGGTAWILGARRADGDAGRLCEVGVVVLVAMGIGLRARAGREGGGDGPDAPVEHRHHRRVECRQRLDRGRQQPASKRSRPGTAAFATRIASPRPVSSTSAAPTSVRASLQH